MSAINDPRHIANGWEIPTETYSDQPYIVQTDDGAWLCAVTTGSGIEGASGQHVITMRSTDRGRRWERAVDVEPVEGPEASYAVMLKAPSGRVYIFYNHNTDNLRTVRSNLNAMCYDNGDNDGNFAWGSCTRVDTLGYYVFKYSDDHGKSWSAKRYPIAVREMALDRENAYGGKVRFFWNVGKPFIKDGAAFCSLHKVGAFGEGFLEKTQGVLLKSDNLLTEAEPEKIVWETLPDGDYGLCAPEGAGLVAEEQSYVELSDGTLYVVYRTRAGHPCYARSFDGGHSWTEPAWQCFANGRVMKHPRAANFIWKVGQGRYLYWFHNHGGRFVPMLDKSTGYEDRNPVWVCAGVEVDDGAGKTIAWSEPEILLYDDDSYIRMSYPDLVIEDGRCYVTETQKDKARVHLIPTELLEGMWAQFADGAGYGDGGGSADVERGKIFTAEGAERYDLPELPQFLQRDHERADHGTKDLRGGFTICLEVQGTVAAGEVLLSNRTEDGRGFEVRGLDGGRVELIVNDGWTENRWACDNGMLAGEEGHRVAIIMDGGPKLMMFVVDGVLNDGGEQRQFGWGRYSPNLRTVQGEAALTLAGPMGKVSLYDRALTISEAVLLTRK